MSLVGSYSILAVIDQTHLSTVVRDKVTNAILGWTQEVRMTRNTGRDGGNKEFVVALFLNIPANNCAILQKGNELIVIPAGQHYIVDPSITLRGMFTFGENQLEMPTKVCLYPPAFPAHTHLSFRISSRAIKCQCNLQSTSNGNSWNLSS
jgi:hypothetical protein